MPYLPLSGVDLWYEDSGGDGLPVVFLHAASGTCEGWVYHWPAFTSAGYRCIAYDRRTWGRSRTADAEHQAGLFGRRPARAVDRFVFGASPPCCYGSWRNYGAGLRADAPGASPQPGCCQHNRRSAGRAIPGSAGVGFARPRYRISLWSCGNWDRPTVGPILRARIRWLEIEVGSRPEGLVPSQPTREPITYVRLETMRVQTLVVSGEADLLSPPALMRMLAAHIPASRFVSLPEAGHAGFWERPEVWNGIVLEFIGQH